MLRALAAWGLGVLLVVSVLVLAGEGDPAKRAVLIMGLGLVSIWCVLGGLVMRLARDRFVAWAGRLRVG
jgi:hypothetical protein